MIKPLNQKPFLDNISMKSITHAHKHLSEKKISSKSAIINEN